LSTTSSWVDRERPKRRRDELFGSFSGVDGQVGGARRGGPPVAAVVVRLDRVLAAAGEIAMWPRDWLVALIAGCWPFPDLCLRVLAALCGLQTDVGFGAHV
jgi:hypothetical protein